MSPTFERRSSDTAEDTKKVVRQIEVPKGPSTLLTLMLLKMVPLSRKMIRGSFSMILDGDQCVHTMKMQK